MGAAVGSGLVQAVYRLEVIAMSATSMKKLGSFVAAAVGTAVVVGCQQVPVNTSPSATPPAITWSVTEVGGGPPVQFGAVGTLNIKPGRVYDVSAHAQTPSGVKSLTVGGSGGWVCRSGDLASATTADLASVSSSQQPHDGKAWDTLSTFEAIGTGGGQLCHSGLTFRSGGFSLSATAKNFAAMTRTGHLALNITP
ncbi:MAG: hypothetical protein ACXVXJ_06480 [Mycobacteriaceae bacterium]